MKKKVIVFLSIICLVILVFIIVSFFKKKNDYPQVYENILNADNYNGIETGEYLGSKSTGDNNEYKYNDMALIIVDNKNYRVVTFDDDIQFVFGKQIQTGQYYFEKGNIILQSNEEDTLDINGKYKYKIKYVNSIDYYCILYNNNWRFSKSVSHTSID